MEYVTFIVQTNDGYRETYTTRYRDGIESEVDAAWDEVYSVFPDAEYIEMF